MKQTLQNSFKKISSFCLFTLMTAVAFAQDSSVTSTTTSTSSTTEQTWYMQPWAWVVGAIILILIIVLAARGGGDKSGNSDSVTVKRTVTRESDTV
ncbi:MAG: hypothetical protein WKF88_08045 [Ferruginibacter sp.]